MIRLDIKNSDGTQYITEYFDTLDIAIAWFTKEQTRPYWDSTKIGVFVDITPLPIILSAQEILIEKWDNLRTRRNNLLNSTDWALLGDSPLNAEQKAIMSHYRNTLRNLPQSNSNPDLIVFPTFPEL